MSASTAYLNPSRLDMSKDADSVSRTRTPRIDIWGSCVSRDTLEFMPDFDVGVYVARQSAIVALSPAREISIPLDALRSDFQRRMLRGDMEADAGRRIEKAEGVCVLVDIVDERGGVWQFPDGTYLTNSVEASRTGIAEWGPQIGGRLIEFGTDEHFQKWREGFIQTARQIGRAGKAIVLLDIAWAEVFEGQAPPRGIVSSLTAAERGARRKVGHFLHTTKRERSLRAGLLGINAAPRSKGDEHVRVARDANARARRYIAEARKLASATISRPARAVRMSRSHKWGIGPYHYSNHDYERIRDELYEVVCRA